MPHSMASISVDRPSAAGTQRSVTCHFQLVACLLSAEARGKSSIRPSTNAREPKPPSSNLRPQDPAKRPQDGSMPG